MSSSRKPSLADAHIPDAIRGRGASTRLDNRFAKTHTEAIDDGWDPLHGLSEDERPGKPRTRVTSERARSIISRNTSPDVGFNQSVNPYRGCEHGCVYCFARPTHSYLDLSPGLDFETQLFAKTNAAERLRAELAKPGYVPEPIALGINTDGWQPIEREQRISRACLQVLAETGHPVSIVTKSALITRDLDILAPMAQRGLAQVMVSVTTLDNRLSAALEPRAAAPHTRLKTIRTLHEAGVPVGALIAPVIPAITDSELEAILEAVHGVGAQTAGYILLRLPHELKDIWRLWLAQHFPDRAAKVMNILNDMRGGKDYDSRFGSRMRGQGVFAQLLAARFKRAHAQLGFAGMPALRTDAFCPPRPDSPQADLFA